MTQLLFQTGFCGATSIVFLELNKDFSDDLKVQLLGLISTLFESKVQTLLHVKAINKIMEVTRFLVSLFDYHQWFGYENIENYK